MTGARMNRMTDDPLVTRMYGALSDIFIPSPPLPNLPANLLRDDQLEMTVPERTHAAIVADYGEHLVDITDPAAKAAWDARTAAENAARQQAAEEAHERALDEQAERIVNEWDGYDLKALIRSVLEEASDDD